MTISAFDSALSTDEFSDQVEEYGIPTLSLVRNLKQQADRAFNAKKWSEAEKLYNEHAEKANFLANIISQGIEPYYSASYDDKKYFYSTALSKDESTSNKYKQDRNVSFLKRGICLYELGDMDGSLVLLMKALDLIDLENIEAWNYAREYIYKLVGYSSGDVN